MLSRLDAVKISRDSRLVIRRVLLGGDGFDSCGKSERSIERFGECRLLDDKGDGVGDGCMAMVAICSSFETVVAGIVEGRGCDCGETCSGESALFG